jgi:hypothetical protein
VVPPDLFQAARTAERLKSAEKPPPVGFFPPVRELLIGHCYLRFPANI